MKILFALATASALLLSPIFAQPAPAAGTAAQPAPSQAAQPAPAAPAAGATQQPAQLAPAAPATGAAQQPAQPAPAPAPTPPAGGGSFLTGLLPIILIFVVFYFLLIMPQQRQRKKHVEMLQALKAGDKVVVLGGVHGVITRLRDNTLSVKIAENTEIEVDRSSVTYKQGGEPPK